MSGAMLEKIPTLSDQHLAALLENARRLSTTGSAKQQSDAREMLPLLEAETTQRGEAKALAAKTRLADRNKARRTAKSAG